jgi:hypothetical protein
VYSGSWSAKKNSIPWLGLDWLAGEGGDIGIASMGRNRKGLENTWRRIGSLDGVLRISVRLFFV